MTYHLRLLATSAIVLGTPMLGYGCPVDKGEESERLPMLSLSIQEKDDFLQDISSIDLRGRCLIGTHLVNAPLLKSPLGRFVLYGADVRHAVFDTTIKADPFNRPGRVTKVKRDESLVPFLTINKKRDQSSFDSEKALVFEEINHDTENIGTSFKIEMNEDDDMIDIVTQCPYEAFSTLREWAKRGHPFAQFVAAFLHEMYGQLEDDPETARELYEKAAAQKYWPAVNNLAWMNEQGYGMKKAAPNKALELYEQAAEHEPMAAFNVIRFKAIHWKEKDACFELGRFYRETITQFHEPPDLKLAFYWFTRAAEQKHILGCREAASICLRGIESLGIEKDLDLAHRYLRFASDPLENESYAQGDPLAQFIVGNLYEHGLGVPQDYEHAMFLYEKAGTLRGSETQYYEKPFERLGPLYEEGKAGDVDRRKALNCYLKLARQGRITGLYNAGRLYEYIKTDIAARKSIEFYQKVLEKDPTHVDAMYLLGLHYMKGLGIKKNSQLGKLFIQQASEGGNTAAKITHRLLEHKGHLKTSCLPSMEALHSDIQMRHNAERYFIQQELEKDYKIPPYSIREDYQACMAVVENIKDTWEESCILNFDFLMADPYSQDYALRGVLSKEQTSPQNLRKIFDALKETALTYKTLTHDVVFYLDDIYSYIADTHTVALRESFMHLYQAYVEQYRGEVIPSHVEDPIAYGQSRMAKKLVDDLNTVEDLGYFLMKQEKELKLPDHMNISLGTRLSYLITQYKYQFLDQHYNILRGYSRDTRGELALLHQRMRLPLNLPGSFIPYFNDLTQNQASLHNPADMMQRFFLGGETVFEHEGRHMTVSIKGLTPMGLCRYIREAMNDKINKVLTQDHFEAFIHQDPILKPAFEKAFGQGFENIYFDSFAGKGFHYTLEAFKHLLLSYGYIIERDPQKENKTQCMIQ